MREILAKKKDAWGILPGISIGDIFKGFFEAPPGKEVKITLTAKTTRQMPDLKNVGIEDSPNVDTTQTSDQVLLNRNLEIKRCINKMLSEVYDKTKGALHSDQIIELYDTRYKVSHYDYSYTDFERRSDSYYPKKNQNEPEPKDVFSSLGKLFLVV